MCDQVLDQSWELRLHHFQAQSPRSVREVDQGKIAGGAHNGPGRASLRSKFLVGTKADELAVHLLV
ncbi:MAG: hypothetical protein ACR2PL_17160 [Dehalococcoidia bacterium]